VCKVKVSASSVQNAVAVAPSQGRTYVPGAAPAYVQAPSAVSPKQVSQPPPQSLIFPDVVTTQRSVKKRTRGVQQTPLEAAVPKTGPVYVAPTVAPVAPVYVPPAPSNAYVPPIPDGNNYQAPARAGPVFVPAPPGVAASEGTPLRNKARKKFPSRQVTPVSYSSDLSTASDATGYNVDLKSATTSGIPVSDLTHSASGGHGGGGGMFV
jgi:hypothetical protein